MWDGLYLLKSLRVKLHMNVKEDKISLIITPPAPPPTTTTTFEVLVFLALSHHQIGWLTNSSHVYFVIQLHYR